MKPLLLLPVFILLLLTSSLFPQDTQINEQKSAHLRLEGNHSIYLITGMKMNSVSSADVSFSDVKTETNFQMSLGYQYWFLEEWAVNASIGFFSAEADIHNLNVSAIVVMPVVFGFSYYPEALSLGRAGRVHFGMNTGAYIGTATKNKLDGMYLGSSAISETVFGIEPNAGIDFIISDWFRIGPSFSYHLISQFSEVIGKRKNYSGPIFSLRMGVLL